METEREKIEKFKEVLESAYLNGHNVRIVDVITGEGILFDYCVTSEMILWCCDRLKQLQVGYLQQCESCAISGQCTPLNKQTLTASGTCNYRKEIKR